MLTHEFTREFLQLVTDRPRAIRIIDGPEEFDKVYNERTFKRYVFDVVDLEDERFELKKFSCGKQVCQKILDALMLGRDCIGIVKTGHGHRISFDVRELDVQGYKTAIVTVDDTKRVCSEQWAVKDVSVSEVLGIVDVDITVHWWTMFVPNYKKKLLKTLKETFDYHSPLGIDVNFHVHRGGLSRG